MAYGRNQNGTIDGKLYGAMIANTPIGWRTLTQSMPAASCSRAWPIIRVGMPAAVSTFSRPRPTSPFDSSNVLPCSCVQSSQSSSMCSTIRLRRSNMYRARAATGTSRQVSNAFFAALTAASTSAAVPIGTEPSFSRVAGFVTSKDSRPRDSTHSPPT